MDRRAMQVLGEVFALPLAAQLQVVAAVLDRLDVPAAGAVREPSPEPPAAVVGRPTPAGQ